MGQKLYMFIVLKDYIIYEIDQNILGSDSNTFTAKTKYIQRKKLIHADAHYVYPFPFTPVKF